MQKTKWALISAAVLIALGGAFAAKPKAQCENQTQYVRYGNSYLPAGTYGMHYTCQGSAGVCTFVLSNPANPNSYVPCRTGSFSWVY